MRYMVFTAVCLVGVGCQQQFPTQPAPAPQREKIIIIERQKTVPYAPAPKPAPQPQIRIDLHPPKSTCTEHHHCGKCDVCKKNGWVIVIK